jgi:MFS family permease
MPSRWSTLLAVCVGTFMLLLDISVEMVALPLIRRALGASFSELQWVVDAYALTLAATLLTSGSLADRYGRRRFYLLGLFLVNVPVGIAAMGVRYRGVEESRDPSTGPVDWLGFLSLS